MARPPFIGIRAGRRFIASGARILAAWFFALLLVPDTRAQPPASSPATTPTVELLEPQGEVEVRRAGTDVWMPATTNTTLRAGDTVRTGKASRALVRLSADNAVRLDELSVMPVPRPRRPGQRGLLRLLRGAAYFFHRGRPAETEFETPLVSGAIRGTEFHLTVAEDGRTTLLLIDGEVELTNALGQLRLAGRAAAVVEPNQAPQRTAFIEAVNVIQWCLYYPGVLNVDELGWGGPEPPALSESLAAYRSGDLLAALAKYPAGREPAADAEKIYLAALLLGVGQVEQAEAHLASLTAPSALADALRLVIAAVKFQPHHASRITHHATFLLAASYFAQSQAQLEAALQAARAAVERAPQFGFAWARLAEMEFSFGRTRAAAAAVERALALSPRHAQALALKGFLLSAENRITAAIAQFDEAIAIDSALGNAWLGRGLCRMRHAERGMRHQGAAHSAFRIPHSALTDLLVAAALEPNRAALRSYLGKAWGQSGDFARAATEFALARQLDSSDPTAWFYSALLNQQRNRINEAIADLERAGALNDRRGVYRSRLLLDQDRAARSANLARVYQEAGLFEVGVREAGRAVTGDYANHSAHLFLANSYAALGDPNAVNLRYETAALSELLLVNLLAPPGASTLSRYVSQQEYSRLFERDGLGVSASTEYRSSGDWAQTGSQHGTFGNFSYALDAAYRSRTGQRPNDDFTEFSLVATVKQQLTPQDMVYVQAGYLDLKSGDVRQYYDQDEASRALRIKESQEPNLFVGYRREWSPGIDTLLLGGRLLDDYRFRDPAVVLPIAVRSGGSFLNFANMEDSAFALDQRSRFEAYSAELQQVWQTPKHTVIGGARFQSGQTDSEMNFTNLTVFSGKTLPHRQQNSTDLQRASVYGYYTWHPLEELWLVGGLSYDQLRFPQNIDLPPISNRHEKREQVSPKFGLMLTPAPGMTARAAYARSLGGLYFDNSVRLEPSQVAGFNQAFRSLLPESVGGLAAGARFESWHAEIEQRLPTRTYLGVGGEMLRSEASRTMGVFNLDLFGPLVQPGGLAQDIVFREQSLAVSANQLLGDEWAVGVRYRVSKADLDERLPALAVPPGGDARIRRDFSATMQRAELFALYNHPCGFFAQLQALWTAQRSGGYQIGRPADSFFRPNLEDENFWQLNAFVGYRFPRRRAEVQLGLLNLTDRDYRLNPLNFYAELPRERTVVVRARFNF